MRNNVFGIFRLLEHQIHSVPMQNDKRWRFSIEAFVAESHGVSVIIGRRDDITNEKDRRTSCEFC